MKTLNLVYPDKSEIKYKKQEFPDGQRNIVLENWYDTSIPGEVMIKSRLNNFMDLELISCSVASLRCIGIKVIHLYTPYFLGSRSDRRFGDGSNHYLKQVICPIINSLKFESVSCLDAHSSVLEACIDNYRHLSLSNFYDWTNKEIGSNIVIIQPDAGASKRTQGYCSQIRYTGDIIECSKSRDTDGKLTKVKVPISGVPVWDKDLVLVDDIFDFGTTFTNIAKEIGSKRNGKLILVVTHSIQKEGIELALKYFDTIYSTNSYADYDIKGFKQLNVF